MPMMRRKMIGQSRHRYISTVSITRITKTSKAICRFKSFFILSDFLSVIEMAEYKCAIDAHYFHPPGFSRELPRGVSGSTARHAYYRDLQVPARARSYLGIRLTVARLHGTCQRRYGQRCCTAYEERRIKECFPSPQL